MSEKLPAEVRRNVEDASRKVPTTYFGQKRQQRHLQATEAYVSAHVAIAQQIAEGWRALADIRHAQHDYDRAEHLYRNPHDVFAADAAHRRTLRKAAEAAEVRADTDYMRAQMEQQEVLGEHRKVVPPEPALPEDEGLDREVGLVQKIHALRNAYREAYRDAVSRVGGEENLTDEEKADLKRQHDEIEQLAKEAGV